MAQSKGLARAKEIYENRDRRAKELKAEGKKVIGYFCCYPPVEVMTAAGVVPYRILGDMNEPVTLADAHIETLVCTFLRSCFDLAFKGRYDFLDGMVMPHACDGTERYYPAWKLYFSPAYSHFVNVPHSVSPSNFEFFTSELGYFRKTLQEFSGAEISEPRLREAIALHNENRASLRELCYLRKQDPPLISGVEMTEILVATVSIPVEECNELLKEVVAEVKERKERPEKKKARVLIWGSPIDDVEIIRSIEDGGANVVMDDICIGTRYYWHDVEITGDPLYALAMRYLDKIPCPRTFRGTAAKERLGYIVDYAREFKANGVIFYVLRHCDTHSFDLPDLRDLFTEAGLKVLPLMSEYTVSGIMEFKTRVEAFIEMMEQEAKDATERRKGQGTRGAKGGSQVPKEMVCGCPCR